MLSASPRPNPTPAGPQGPAGRPAQHRAGHVARRGSWPEVPARIAAPPDGRFPTREGDEGREREKRGRERELERERERGRGRKRERERERERDLLLATGS